MFIIEELKKRWYLIVGLIISLLLIVASAIYALFFAAGLTATIFMSCASGGLFGVLLVMLILEIYLASSSPKTAAKNQKSFTKAEALGKWKDEEKRVDDLAEKVLQDRQRFEELKRKEPKDLIKERREIKEEYRKPGKEDGVLGKSNKNLELMCNEHPTLSEDNKTHSNSKTTFVDEWVPKWLLQILFQPSGNKSTAIDAEIEQIEKSISEKLSLVNETLFQLDSDKNTKIAQLTMDTKKLEEQINNCKR